MAVSPPVPTGTVTFFFTDIEGSTRLWEAHPEPMRVAIARHDALLKQAVEQNNGYRFKTTGDGIAAAFALASDALAAALAAQTALLAEPWAESVSLRSRMSLHTGAAELRDGDYFGTTLSRAERLMSSGHGGQVLLSDVTYELTRDALPNDVTLLPLGEHRLKDLARPETIYQLAHPTLPAEFPLLRTLDITPNNLPQQVTSFVGRESALAEVASLLSKTRLLTLTGSGGSGKTRLGLQAAADTLEHYTDGVWLVELAPLADTALVPQTIASTLGVSEQSGQSITQTLTDQLKAKQLLLVLDNCEHLLSACAQLVAALIRACPNVKVLATSREPLQIGGEQTFRVPPLSLPDPKRSQTATPDNLSQFESVRLFIDRASLVKADFTVTNTNAPALSQLCWRLDGIPLALELAAARVRSLSVEQINDRLDHRFRLLTGGDRSALPRQQTLRALVDWSYDLLTEPEKTLLARLSVLAGGWTLATAEAVCAFAPLEDWEMLDLLTSLADKSLLQTEEEAGLSRYRMLETVRQYSAEKLIESGDKDAVQTVYADFFVALAEEAQTQLAGPEQIIWLNRLEVELDNVRAVLDLCAAKATSTVAGADAPGTKAALSGLRLSGSLGRFWWVRGYLTEGREHLRRALAVQQAVQTGSEAEPDTVTAKRAIARALGAAGFLAWAQGDYEPARSLREEGLALFREIGDKRGIANALGGLSLGAGSQGDFAAARAFLNESLALSREIGDKHGIANALRTLGDVINAEGDFAVAQPLLEESLVLFREVGDKRGTHNVLLNLGGVAMNKGDFTAAQALLEESLTLCREIGNKRGIAHALGGLSQVAREQGDYGAARSLGAESLILFRSIGDKGNIAYGLAGIATMCAAQGNARQAILLWAAAAALRQSLGASQLPSEQVRHDEQVALVRAELGEPAFTSAWQEGSALSWEQATERALQP